MTVQPSSRHQRRRIVVHAVILLAWFAAGVLVVANQQRIRDQPSASVLFIGNSYTYFNNLPEIFAALATEAGHHTRVTMAAPGGWRLKDHWEKGEALGLLRKQHWNYVVLQEQSTLGVDYYVEGRTRVAGDELFRPYAARWASEVRKAGATPVFRAWANRALGVSPGWGAREDVPTGVGDCLPERWLPRTNPPRFPANGSP